MSWSRRVVVFSIAIYDQDGKMLLGTNSDNTGDDPGRVAGKGSCRFAFSRFPVLDGIYNVSVGIHSHDGETIYDQRAEKDVIEVMSQGREVGLVHFPMRTIVASPGTPPASS